MATIFIQCEMCEHEVEYQNLSGELDYHIEKVDLWKEIREQEKKGKIAAVEESNEMRITRMTWWCPKCDTEHNVWE